MSAAHNTTKPQHAKVRSDCVISSPAAVPFRIPASFSGTSTPLTPRSAAALSSASLHAQRTRRPMFIGIGGGRGSGKEHTCHNIISTLRRLGHAELADRVVHLHLDDFHRAPSASDSEQLRLGNEQINYDHPESYDFALLHKVLAQLGSGEPTEVPMWDRRRKERKGWRTVECTPRVVLLEGTLVLFGREVRECLDMRVFLDVDSDTRLGRQVRAAIEQDEQVDLKRFLDLYLFVAKPSFEEFVWPTKRWADVIIPKGDTNGVAIELIAQRLIDLGQDP